MFSNFDFEFEGVQQGIFKRKTSLILSFVLCRCQGEVLPHKRIQLRPEGSGDEVEEDNGGCAAAWGRIFNRVTVLDSASGSAFPFPYWAPRLQISGLKYCARLRCSATKVYPP